MLCLLQGCRVGAGLAHAPLLDRTMIWYARWGRARDDGDISPLPAEEKSRRGEGSPGLFGYTNGCHVCTTPFTFQCFIPLGVPFYSPLLPSLLSQSCGHFHISIAAPSRKHTHRCQLIIGLHFVIIYCSQRRESRGWGVRKRWEKERAYMRNGCSQFPIAVKHLAKFFAGV